MICLEVPSFFGNKHIFDINSLDGFGTSSISPFANYTSISFWTSTDSLPEKDIYIGIKLRTGLSKIQT